MMITTEQSLRRKSFLRACECIRQYYEKPEKKETVPPHQEHVELDEEENERSEAVRSAEFKESVKKAEEDAHMRMEGVRVIRTLLDEFSTIPKDDRLGRIRAAERVFKSVIDYECVLLNYRLFYESVYKKIEDMTKELDDFHEKMETSVAALLEQTQQSLSTLKAFPYPVKELSTVKAYLDTIQSTLKGVPMACDDFHLRTLFATLKQRKPIYDAYHST